MLALVVQVCLINSPEHCKDVKLQYMEENLTPMQCMMSAQPEVAKWAEGHPKWVVKRWTCKPEEQVRAEKDI